MISVITPFYNSSEIFQKTYDAVVSQSFRDFEWIVVDDGSELHESEKLQHMLVDSRVRVLSLSINVGAGSARNCGLAEVKGDFITFIDAGDEWDKDFLIFSLTFLNSKNVRACFSGYRRAWRTDGRVSVFNPTKVIASPARLLSGCDISCLTFFGAWDAEAKQTRFGEQRARNDLVFFFRYAESSGPVIPTCEVLATYNIEANSISSNKWTMIKYQWNVCRVVGKKSVILSLAYTVLWAIRGVKKYAR